MAEMLLDSRDGFREWWRTGANVAGVASTSRVLPLAELLARATVVFVFAVNIISVHLL